MASNATLFCEMGGVCDVADAIVRIVEHVKGLQPVGARDVCSWPLKSLLCWRRTGRGQSHYCINTAGEGGGDDDTQQSMCSV